MWITAFCYRFTHFCNRFNFSLILFTFICYFSFEFIFLSDTERAVGKGSTVKERGKNMLKFCY